MNALACRPCNWLELDPDDPVELTAGSQLGG